MAALLVFIMATLDIVFGRKKLLDSNGPFGDNVFKIRLDIYLSNRKRFPCLRSQT